MPVRLTAYLPSGTLARKNFDEGEFIIGRSIGAALALADPRVSREHARLVGAGGAWRIEDLASKNGTRIDGRTLASASISGDAWLSIGGVPVRIEMLDAPAALSADPNLADAAIDSLIEGCLDAFREVAGASCASLWERREGGDFELAQRRGEDGPEEKMGAIRQVGDAGVPFFANDPGGSIICLPVVLDGAVAGVIYADSAEAVRALRDLDRELLRSLAEQAAIGLAARRAR